MQVTIANWVRYRENESLPVMTWPAETLEAYAQHQTQKAINKGNNSLFMERFPQGSNTVQKEKKRSLPNLIA